MASLITETPIPGKIIGVKRFGGFQLEAHLDGDLAFPVVIDFAGTSQYPAWDPCGGKLTMWDSPVPDIVEREFSRAWASTMSHPSFAHVA